MWIPGVAGNPNGSPGARFRTRLPPAPARILPFHKGSAASASTPPNIVSSSPAPARKVGRLPRRDDLVEDRAARGDALLLVLRHVAADGDGERRVGGGDVVQRVSLRRRGARSRPATGTR